MSPSRRDSDTTLPSLEDLLRHAVAIGAVLVVLLPAARGSSDALGWLPMWLLAMPLTAWWALRRFNLPASRSPQATTSPVRRRRPGTQARRRVMANARRANAARAAA